VLAHEIEWQPDPASSLSNEEQHRRFLRRWQGAARMPTFARGLVPVVNLPCLDAARPLKLSGALLGEIFAGQIGHWRDPAITAALARHGRNGVPLYLVYRPGDPVPRILPELLTASTVVDALR
jgi:ABC-type phosphate transport system substrate-binding protein